MIFFISINQGASELFKLFLGITNNLPFYRVYMLIETVLLTELFILIIATKNFKRNARIILAVFLTGFILDSILYKGIWAYPSFFRITEGCIIIGFTGRYFFKVFREATIVILLEDFGFWVSTGLIVYFLSNSLLFIFSEFVVTLSDPSYYLIWTIHAVLTILLYIAYTIAIRCKTSPSLS